MSAFIDQAEKIKTALTAVSALSTVTVIVDRQKDLGNEISQAIAKSKGAAIIISPDSGSNFDTDSNTLSLTTSIAVTIVTKPIKRKGETDALTILEEALKAIHDLPLIETTHHNRTAKVQGWKLISNPTYLIYNITIKTPTNL